MVLECMYELRHPPSYQLLIASLCKKADISFPRSCTKLHRLAYSVHSLRTCVDPDIVHRSDLKQLDVWREGIVRQEGDVIFQEERYRPGSHFPSQPDDKQETTSALPNSTTV